MKKVILALINIMLFNAAGHAEVLSPDKALERAFSNTIVRKATASKGDNYSLTDTGYGESGPAYYVFSNTDNSLILSANDCAAPVLAILDSPIPNLDNIAPATREWLNEYSRQISSAATTSASYNTNLPEHANITPMLTTTWGQNAPYNSMCPTNSAGQPCYAGCVATAMAQTMKHFGYPYKGTGNASYTWNNGVRNTQLEMDFSTTTFSWANMPDKCTTASPATQRNAVATLFKAVGYAVEMNYSADTKGSTATSPKIAEALVNNFGYDKGITLDYRDYYTAEEWDNLIYNNLATVGPVIYNGRDSGGGHSFVCDGYRTGGYYHINWGWEGVSDGYYLLQALEPDKVGVGGGTGAYNYDQNAVLGIRPAVASSTAAVPFMAIRGNMKISVNGQKITLSADESTDMGGFYNMSYLTADFDIGLRFYNGFMSEYVTVITGRTLKPLTGVKALEITVPQTIMNGPYTLYPVYRVGGPGPWKPFRYDVENSYGYINIIVDGNNITVDQPVSTDPQNVIATLPSGNSYKIGTVATIPVRFTNNNASDREITAFLGIGTVEGSTLQTMLRSQNQTNIIPARQYIDTVYNITIPTGMDPGQYRIFVGAYNGDKAYVISSSTYVVNIEEDAGTDTVTTDENASQPTRYYNLQGVEVSPENMSSGIYILRQGTHSSLIFRN